MKIVYRFFILLYSILASEIALDTWEPAPLYSDERIRDNYILSDATERMQEANAKDVAANTTYDNILTLDAAAEAEIVAEAGRRVAEAASKIAAENEEAAAKYAAEIKPI
ncbi:hypothetical protein COBT_002657 [Conglomerata obtusa]